MGWGRECGQDGMGTGVWDWDGSVAMRIVKFQGIKSCLELSTLPRHGNEFISKNQQLDRHKLFNIKSKAAVGCLSLYRKY